MEGDIYLRNRYEVDGDVVRISLCSRKYGYTETLVSKSRLPKLMSMDVTWFLYPHESCINYVVAVPPGSKSQIRLHRFITECSDKKYVLHLDSNGLNNVDSNLLITDRNRTGARLKRQLPVGVGFDIQRLMWYAVVEVNGEQQTVGYFLSEKAATEAFEQMKGV